MDNSNPGHRKIELQGKEDFSFLIDNVRRAAAESIAAAFPVVEGAEGGEKDELHIQVEKLVNEVCSLSFSAHPCWLFSQPCARL